MEEAKAKGTYEAPGEANEDNSMSWGRGTKMGEAKANFAASEQKQMERMSARQTRQEPEDTGFARGNFTKRDAPMRTGMGAGPDADGPMRRPAP